MNDFLLYHNLCNLSAQLEPYAQDSEPFAELKKLVDHFSSKTYRVAVIGEFKRGKSSLVNALLGTEILPTDILPTTAVINRIVYSLDQKIVIYFRNGEIKESTIDSLAEYATKLDKEKEQFAETIREIVVHYPSVLGQNHIELIDTPGLNDNESMTETTLNVLGSIDTAIVVISATMPLSMTEQNLICDLIRQTDIYNLVFAVTFIDRVSDEEDEQDRVVELIKNRLSEDTLQHFCQAYEDAQLIEKAKRILTKPNVYAVSSKQAIQGFIKGKNDLIEKSRFTHFKYNLSALLTANQEKDRLYKINRICADITMQAPAWLEGHLQRMEEKGQAMQEKCELLKETCNDSSAYMNQILLRLDTDAKEKKEAIIAALTNGVEIEKHLKRFFIAELSSLKRSEFCEGTLSAALGNACTQANSFMKMVIGQWVLALDSLSEAAFWEIGVHYKDVLHELDLYPVTVFNKDMGQRIPTFQLSETSIFKKMNSLHDECMPPISEVIHYALKTLSENMEGYLAAYRLLMLKYQKEVKSILESAAETMTAMLTDHRQRLQNEHSTMQTVKDQIANTLATIQDIIN